MATPASSAAARLARIVPGSPAWKPQARLALDTSANSAASSPIRQAPNDSPASTLRSIVVMAELGMW